MAKNKSHHESIDDDGNGSQSSSLSEENSEFGGYVDQHGTPNPLYVSSNDLKADSSSDDESLESAITRQRFRNQRRLNLCIDFFSDLSFLFGSSMYLLLALSESKELFLAEDNDSTTTDTIFDFYDNNSLSFATVGQQNVNTQHGWFLEDKVVFTGITLYMLYGFWASLLMFSAGALRLYTASNPSDRVPYAFMIFASSLAMASSAIANRSPFWSNACFSISIHWYALQAATLLLWNSTPSLTSSSTLGNACDSCLRLSGDLLFLLATIGGIILSYLNLFEATEVLAFPHEILVIGTGVVWWSASCMYLLQTLCALVFRRPINEDDSESYFSGGNDEKQIPKSLPRDDTESINEDDEENADAEEQTEDEEHSVWTAGPGPSHKELIAKSSLDEIFSIN